MLNKIFILNIVLLICHQADAAYWQEWEMFHMPGGIQVFGLFNFVAFMLGLSAFMLIVQRRKVAYRLSYALAAVGAMVLPIHATFALAGYSQFNLPISMLWIVASFFAALAQLYFTRQAKAEFIV